VVALPNKLELERLNQLRENVPDIWEGKSVLYIGANAERFHYYDYLREKNCKVDVLEIDAKACKYLRTLDLNSVIEGDVITARLFRYDIVFWSHGPELIFKGYFKYLVERLEKAASEMVVMMCPWGRYSYTTEELKRQKYPNIASLYEEDFKELGYETSTLGEKDVNGSNLLAWRMK